MRTIAIRAKKGGIGKSSSSCNIGSWLANNGKTVCLCDVDPQFNLTTMLGVSQSQVRGTIRNVLAGSAVDDVLIKARENLFLIPANSDLSDSGPVLTERPPELTLRRRLETLSLRWDYLIFDCPPGTSPLIDNVLCYVSEVWAPLQVEFLSLEGLDQVTHEVNALNRDFGPYGVKAKVTAIIPTMYDKRASLSGEVLNAAKSKYGTVVTTPIHRTVRLGEAPSHGQTIFEYDPKGIGSSDYEQVSREVSTL